MSQKILSGVNSIRDAVEGKKVFLVRSRSYDKLDLKELIDQYAYAEFTDFTSNPRYEQVVEGVRKFNSEKCEMVVAVGGGSTIDTAKCIKLFCAMESSKNYLEQEAVDARIPLIAVPTTAGSGSESTCHAVIYYEDTKRSISSEYILPDVVILEPSVLKQLPVYQKKCTMLDALCQAIESWWSVRSTDESKAYSKKAISLIMEHYEEYINNNTLGSAEKIMLASNYSGRAINITATTAAHAMSYKLTSMYNLPHGHAVAICMAEVWEYIGNHIADCTDDRGERYLTAVLDEISDFIDISSFKQLLRKLEMGYPRSEERNRELAMLVSAVNIERLSNTPVRIASDDLRIMYGRII